MSNKGTGQGQNGVLSHRDDTEWKMTDSNKRIRFYFSVARDILELGIFLIQGKLIRFYFLT